MPSSMQLIFKHYSGPLPCSPRRFAFVRRFPFVLRVVDGYKETGCSEVLSKYVNDTATIVEQRVQRSTINARQNMVAHLNIKHEGREWWTRKWRSSNAQNVFEALIRDRNRFPTLVKWKSKMLCNRISVAPCFPKNPRMSRSRDFFGLRRLELKNLCKSL